MPRKVLSRRNAASEEAEVETQQPAPPTTPKMNPGAIAVIAIVLLAAGGLAVKNTLAKPSPVATTPKADTPQADAPKDDATGLVQKVARHIKIKGDEVPTIATVQDAELLKKNNPAFYKYVHNGDRLLIWSDQAILYSPQEDILLAVMPVSVAQPAPTAAAPGSTDDKELAFIEVRNGSGVSGLGRTISAKLKGAGLSVLPPGDAKSKTPYEKTILMVKPGKSLPKTVSQIQSLATVSVVEALPADEAAMKGDILIIVGADANVK